MESYVNLFDQSLYIIFFSIFEVSSKKNCITYALEKIN